MESDGESFVMGAVWIDAVPEGDSERHIDMKGQIGLLIIDIERR